MTLPPVTLETDRLILRPFAPSDEAAYRAIRAKPEVVRFLAGGEAAAGQADETAAVIVSWLSDVWAEPPHYGPWAVVEKASGALIGHLGLRYLPDEGGVTELLYMLDNAHWGKGYATEGGRAALQFGFDTLGLDEIAGFVLPENAASIAVLDRLGFTRHAGLTRAFGLDVIKFSLKAGSVSGV